MRPIRPLIITLSLSVLSITSCHVNILPGQGPRDAKNFHITIYDTLTAFAQAQPDKTYPLSNFSTGKAVLDISQFYPIYTTNPNTFWNGHEIFANDSYTTEEFTKAVTEKKWGLVNTIFATYYCYTGLEIADQAALNDTEIVDGQCRYISTEKPVPKMQLLNAYSDDLKISGIPVLINLFPMQSSATVMTLSGEMRKILFINQDHMPLTWESENKAISSFNGNHPYSQFIIAYVRKFSDPEWPDSILSKMK